MTDAAPKIDESTEGKKKMPAIGAVINFRNGGNKKWVIISRISDPDTGVERLGLCDGKQIKYDRLVYVLENATNADDDNQELVQRAFDRKEDRDLAFQQFDKLRAEGVISDQVTTGTKSVRSAINQAFRHCAETDCETEQVDVGKTAYIERLRTELRRRFCARTDEMKLLGPVDELPELDGEVLHFDGPYEVLNVEIQNQRVELVTIVYIQRFLQGDSPYEPSKKAVSKWLAENNILPYPYKAEIQYKRRTSDCGAYDLMPVKATNEANPFENPTPDENLLHINQEGSVIIDTPESEFGSMHWTLAGYSRKHGLHGHNFLERIIKRFSPDIKSVDALQEGGSIRIIKVWPEQDLDKIRTLFLDDQEKTEFLCNDSEAVTVTATTANSLVESHVRQRGLIIHELEQSVKPISLEMLCEEIGIKPEAITIVNKLSNKAGHSIREVELDDGRGFYIYTKDDRRDDNNSVIVVHESGSTNEYEPVRKLSELSTELQRIQSQ